MEEVINTSESPEILFQRGAEALEAKKYSEAFTALSRAAEANYSPALYLLGKMYHEGRGIPKDRNMAASFFRKGAALNHKKCRKMLDAYYLTQNITFDAARCREDWEKLRIPHAREELKEYVEKNNDFTARYHLLMMEKQDRTKMRKLYNHDRNAFFQELAKDEHLSTYLHRMWLIYISKHQGNLTPENKETLAQELNKHGITHDTQYPDKDMHWLLDAATNGDADAQYVLGVICKDGENGFEKNTSMAKKYFNLPAEQDHIHAQYQSAFLADDAFERVKWLERASENEHQDAQFDLGCALNNGEGIGQDWTEAAKWFRRAAKQGHEKAKENLQLLYKEKRILFNSDDFDHYRYDYKKLKIAAAKPYSHNAQLPIAHYRTSIAKLEARLHELTPDEWYDLHTHRFNLAHIYLSEGYSKHTKNEAMEYLAAIPKDHEKFAEAQKLFEKYKSYNQNGHPLTTFYSAAQANRAATQSANQKLVELKNLIESQVHLLSFLPEASKPEIYQSIMQCIFTLQKWPFIAKSTFDFIKQKLQLLAFDGHEPAKWLLQKNAALEEEFLSEYAIAFSENNIDKIKALCEKYPRELYLHLENAPKTEHYAEIYFMLGKNLVKEINGHRHVATATYCYVLSALAGHSDAQKLISLNRELFGKTLSGDFLPPQQREICERYLLEMRMDKGLSFGG